MSAVTTDAAAALGLSVTKACSAPPSGEDGESVARDGSPTKIILSANAGKRASLREMEGPSSGPRTSSRAPTLVGASAADCLPFFH